MGLKLNLGKQNSPEELKLQEELKNQNIARLSEETKAKLAQDFENDLITSAETVEVTQEDLENNVKRFQDLKRKKMLLLIGVVTTFIVICICALYNTFFRHEWTEDEIYYYANIGKTSYPMEGVQGYLTSNIDKLLLSRLSATNKTDEQGNKIETVYLGIPVVTEIIDKSSSFANVYFSVDINTNLGKTQVNCMVPLSWDGWKYTPAGNINIITTCTASNLEDEQEHAENPYSSFEDIEAVESESTIESAKKYADLFFIALYNGEDVSPYYKGSAKIDSEFLKNNINYVGLTNFQLYQESNANGFNACATITIETSNGMTYITEKYLVIQESGESWIIKGIQ